MLEQTSLFDDENQQIKELSHNKIDLGFLMKTPDYSKKAQLTVEALAPLSMIASLPGKYYRSQDKPTIQMLLGMFENALGFHLTGKSDKNRDKLIKKIAQQHKQTIESSSVGGFVSLLQLHIRLVNSFVPIVQHYEDYWSRHTKHTDDRHINGSRNYDARAIPIINSIKAEKGKLTANDAPKLIKFFPQYYISPTPREYVLPKGTYKFVFETSKHLSEIIGEAVNNPQAPLYLGSNDGWIEANWETIS